LVILCAFASSVAGCLVVSLSPPFFRSYIPRLSFTTIPFQSYAPCLFFLHAGFVGTLSALLIGTLWASDLVAKKRKERNNKGHQKKGKVQKIRRRKKESKRRQPEISAPHFLNQHCCGWQAEPAIRFGRLPSLFLASNPLYLTRPLLSLFRDSGAPISLANTFYFW
jgi:hypothetical protein